MEFSQTTRVEGADDKSRFFTHLRGASLETAWTELPMLTLKSSPRGVQVAVPIDAITRQQMDDIEDYVRKNISTEAQSLDKDFVYKSLYRGLTFYVNIDEDCNCFVFDANSCTIQMGG